jgi:hypothetical protein
VDFIFFRLVHYNNVGVLQLAPGRKTILKIEKAKERTTHSLTNCSLTGYKEYDLSTFKQFCKKLGT